MEQNIQVNPNNMMNSPTYVKFMLIKDFHESQKVRKNVIQKFTKL